MNYLSHFFVDKIDGNDAYNYGLLLPDFSRNYGLKKIDLMDISSYPTSFEKNLVKGSMQHIESDKIFHNSDFFKTTMKQLNQGIYKALEKTKIPRQWFLGHILLELVLDRIISKKHTNIIDQFYQSLGNVEMQDILLFLKQHGVIELELYDKRMTSFFKAEYLRAYQDNEKISHLLNGIYIRSKLSKAWNNSDIMHLANFIPESELIIQNNLPNFELELNTQV